MDDDSVWSSLGDSDDFDLDSFDFDATPVPNNRSPSMDAVKGIAEGTFQAFKDTDIEQAVKRALPSEYEDVFDVKDQVVNSLGEMRDSIAKEFEQNKQTLKAFTKRIVKGSEAILPKGVVDKLSAWAADDPKYAPTGGQVTENAAITSELSSIFDIQRKMDEKKEERQDKKEEVKGLVQFKQFQDTFAQLDAIRKGVSTLVDYQDNILIKYHRKDLENSIKQTNLLMRLVEETAAMRAESKGFLERIQKNTGLPDYVKLQGFEGFMQTARNRMWNNLIDHGLNGNNYIANFIREAKQGAIGWGKGFLQGVANMAGTVNEAREAMDPEMLAELGMTQSQMAGQMGGGMLGDWLRNKSIDKAQEWFKKKYPDIWKKVKDKGVDSKHFFQNIGYYINAWAQDKEFAYTGIRGNIMGLIAQLSRNSFSNDKYTLQRDGVDSLGKPAIFSNKVSKSITDIIPGYLARILREMTILRTGKEDTELVLYNYKDNKFSTSTGIKNTIMNTMVGKGAVETYAQRADTYASVFDKDKTLSDQDRLKIARLFNEHMRSGRNLTDERYLTSIETYKKVFGEDKAKYISSLMKDYLKEGKDGTTMEKVVGLTDRYSNIAGNISGMSNIAGNMQLFDDLGYRDQLRELKLIDNKNRVDMDTILDHLSGASTYDRGEDKPDAEGLSNYITGGVNIRNRGSGTDMRTAERLLKEIRDTLRTDGNTTIIGNSERLDKERNKTLERILKALEKERDPEKREKGINKAVTLLGQIKDISEYSLSALESMKAILASGIALNANPGVISGLAGLLGSATAWTAKTAGKVSLWGAQKYTQFLGGLAKFSLWGTGKAASLAGEVSGRLAQGTRNLRSNFAAMDVYVGDEESPRLTAVAMRAGKYFNMDASPIRKFKDIKGAVMNEEGEVLITEDEFPKAHVGNKKEGIVAQFSDLIAETSKAAANLGVKLGGVYLTAAALGWKAFKWTKDKLIGLKDKIPADIYIRGHLDPILTRAKMIAGEYYDQATGQVIKTVNDIKGTIVDKDGNVILTVEEIKNGIFDKFGNSYSGIMRKVVDRVKELAKKGFNIGRKYTSKAWNKAKEILAKGRDTAIDRIGQDRIDRWSEQARSAWGSASDMTIQMWDTTRTYMRETSERFKESFDKLSTYTQDLLKNSVGTLDVLERIYKLLDDRMPGKKKLGDIDNDGDVDNSVADIIENRKKEKEQEETVQKLQNGEHVDDKKGISLFGKLWKMIKGIFAFGAGILSGGLLTALKKGVSFLGGGILKALKSGAKYIGSAVMAGLSRLGFSRGGMDGDDFDFDEHGRRRRRRGRGRSRGRGRPSRGGFFRRAGRAGRYALGGMLAYDAYDRFSNIDDRWAEGDYVGAAYDAAVGTVEGAGAAASFGGSRLLGAGASRLGSGVARTAGKIGARGLGVAGIAVGAGMDAQDVYQGFKTGNTDQVVSGTSGLGGMAAGAAAGAFLGPVGIMAGAAIGGIVGWLSGMGINSLRHRLKKGKLTPMEELRFVQYGFDPEKDKDKIDIILNSELYMQDALVEKNGQWELDPSKIDGEGFLQLYGVDPNDPASQEPVFKFFQDRLSKVFLANISVLRAMYPQKVLEYADKVSAEDKAKLVIAINKLPISLYSSITSPFPDKPYLYNAQQVKAYLQSKESEFSKNSIDKAVQDADSFWSRPWFEGKEEKEKRLAEVRKEAEKKVGITPQEELKSTTNKSQLEIKGYTTVMVSMYTPGVIDSNGNITLDPVRAIRYIAYGVKDTSDYAKISNLIEFEKTMEDRDFDFVNGVCRYKGNYQDMFTKARAIFTGTDKALFAWIRQRFLPIYLTYRGALYQYKVVKDENVNVINLTPVNKFNLAQKMVSTETTNDSGDKISIWQADYTPWHSQQLANDISYCSKQMDMLRELANESGQVEDKSSTVVNSTTGNSINTSNIKAPSSFTDIKGWAETGQNMMQSIQSKVNLQNTYIGKDRMASSGGYSDESIAPPGGFQEPSPGSEVKSPQVNIKTGIPIIDEMVNAKLYAIKDNKGRTIYGSDNRLLNNFIAVESMGRHDAIAPNNIYKGLGQFGPDAWADANKTLGNILGTYAAGVFNPGINFAAMKGYLIHNAKLLSKRGIPINPLNLYLAHQQGAGGLAKIMSGKADAQLRRNMRSNSGSDTIEGFMNHWGEHFGKRYKSFAGINGTKHEKGGIPGLPSSVGHPATAEEMTSPQSTVASTGIASDTSGNDGFIQASNTTEMTSPATSTGLATNASGTPSVAASVPSLSSIINTQERTQAMPNAGEYKPGVGSRGNNDTTPLVLRNNTNQVSNTVEPDTTADNGKDTVPTPPTGNSPAARAAKYASSRCGARSQGKCARYVREAMQYAGFKFTPKVSAYMYADEGVLEGLGFVRMPLMTKPIIGDIMTFGKAPGHPHGHICIYDGQNWISDFRQNQANPYRNKGSAGRTILWRHNGKPNDAQFKSVAESAGVSPDNRNVLAENTGKSDISTSRASVDASESTPYQPTQPDLSTSGYASSISQGNKGLLGETADAYNELLGNVPNAPIEGSNPGYQYQQAQRNIDNILVSGPQNNQVYQAQRQQIEQAKIDYSQKQIKAITDVSDLMREQVSLSKESLTVLKQMLDVLGKTGNQATPSAYKEPKEFMASNDNSANQSTPLYNQPGVEVKSVMSTKRIPV